MEALEASVKAQRSGRHPAAPSRRSTKVERTKATKTAKPSGGRKRQRPALAASGGTARHRSSA